MYWGGVVLDDVTVTVVMIVIGADLCYIYRKCVHPHRSNQGEDNQTCFAVHLNTLICTPTAAAYQ